MKILIITILILFLGNMAFANSYYVPNNRNNGAKTYLYCHKKQIITIDGTITVNICRGTNGQNYIEDGKT